MLSTPLDKAVSPASDSLPPLSPPIFSSPEGSVEHSTHHQQSGFHPEDFTPTGMHGGNGDTPHRMGIGHGGMYNGNGGPPLGMETGPGAHHHQMTAMVEGNGGYQNLPPVDPNARQLYMNDNNNSNNNNNNNNNNNKSGRGNTKISHGSVAGAVKTTSHVPPRDTQGQWVEPFPAVHSTPFSEHRPEHLQSSAESGFLADNEGEGAWYTSPGTSPKHSTAVPVVSGAGRAIAGGDRDHGQLGTDHMTRIVPSQQFANQRFGIVPSQHDSCEHPGSRIRCIGDAPQGTPLPYGGRGNDYPSRGHLGSRSFDTAQALETRLDSGRHANTPYQHTDHTHSHHSRASRSMSPEARGKSLTRRNYNRLERERPVNPFTAHQWVVPISHQDVDTSEHLPFTKQDTTTQQQATPTNHTHHSSSHSKRTSSGGTSHTHQRHSSKKIRAKHVLSNESIFQDSPQDTPTFQVAAGAVGCHRQQLSLDDTHIYYNTRESLLSQVNGRGTPPMTTPTLSNELEVSQRSFKLLHHCIG